MNLTLKTKLSYQTHLLFNYQERQCEGNHPSNMAPLTSKNLTGKRGTNEPKKKVAPSNRKVAKMSDEDKQPSDQEAEAQEWESIKTILDLWKQLALA